MENFKKTALHINISAYEYQATGDLVIRGFRQLSKLIKQDIAGVSGDFEYNNKSRTSSGYKTNTNLRDTEEVRELTRYFARTMTSCYNTVKINRNSPSDFLFDIYTEEDILDCEGNKIEAIDMLFNVRSFILGITMPSVRLYTKNSDENIIETDTLGFTNIVLKKDTYKNINVNFEKIEDVIGDVIYMKEIDFDLGYGKAFSISINELTGPPGIDFNIIKRNINNYKDNKDVKNYISFKVLLKDNIVDVDGNKINEIEFGGNNSSIVKYYTGYKNKKVTTIK